MLLCDRDSRGRMIRLDALARFASKCEFDATTGCVLWRGGTTQGRGNTAVYGSFWYDGRRWFAHRWAGVHIHGLDLEGVQAGHCCPHCPPRTLCVEHVEPQTQAQNMAEQIDRLGPLGKRKVKQTDGERQHWLFVGLGIREQPDEPEPTPDLPPFFEPPEWLRPFLVDRTVNSVDECPF